MFVGYFDDSGKQTQANERFVVLAGYVASDPFWADFLCQWQHCLVKHDITLVHMRELMFLQGEYGNKSWDSPKRDAVLSDFIRVIKDTELIGFGVGVDATASKQIVPKELTVERGYGNAMEFCFSRVIRLLIERLQKVAARDLLTLIFDCDQEFSPRRFNIFASIREHNEIARDYLASISFANPRYYMALQAADFLAWQTRKQLVQKVGGFDSTTQFKELFEMTPGYIPDYEGEIWNATDLEGILVKPWRDARAKIT